MLGSDPSFLTLKPPPPEEEDNYSIFPIERKIGCCRQIDTVELNDHWVSSSLTPLIFHHITFRLDKRNPPVTLPSQALSCPVLPDPVVAQDCGRCHNTAPVNPTSSCKSPCNSSGPSESDPITHLDPRPISSPHPSKLQHNITAAVFLRIYLSARADCAAQQVLSIQH